MTQVLNVDHSSRSSSIRVKLDSNLLTISPRQSSFSEKCVPSLAMYLIGPSFGGRPLIESSLTSWRTALSASSWICCQPSSVRLLGLQPLTDCSFSVQPLFSSKCPFVEKCQPGIPDGRHRLSSHGFEKLAVVDVFQRDFFEAAVSTQ